MAISNNAETFIRLSLRRRQGLAIHPIFYKDPLRMRSERAEPNAAYPHEADLDEFSHPCPLMGPPFGSAKSSIPLETSGES